MRINHGRAAERLREPPAGVLHAAFWVPLGYAVTRLVGDGVPVLAMVVVCALLAGLYRLIPGGVVPGLVELLAGGGGLLMSLGAAADGQACGEALGEGGLGAVLVFGTVMSVSAFVRVLGSANGREMARHLLVATAALELSLFAVGPGGQVLIDVRDRFTVPTVLLGVMLATTWIGIRSRHGYQVLGWGLLVALGVLALTGSPCAVHPVASLAGTLTFVAIAHFLAPANGDYDSTRAWPDDHTLDHA